MALRRRGWIVLGLLGVPVLAVVLVAVIWGWDLLIPTVEARASAALGRPVTIAHLHIHPGRITRVTADDVVIANPPDWEGEPFAKIPELVAEVDVWTYLRRGEMVVPLVAIHRPELLATQTEQGGANYKLQLAASSGPGAKIGQVVIDDGKARVRLAKLKADVMVGVSTRGEGDQSQIVVDAKGTYAAQPITGQLIGGGLLSLRDTTQPWPVDLKLQNGPTKVSLVGTVMNPLAFAGADLTLQFAGPDMSLLDKLTGLPIPKTPNYQIGGKLDFAEHRVKFTNIRARVGSSDLEGTIEVDPRDDKPEMFATLRSQRVDLADLGGFIGTTPGRVSTPGQSPQQRAEVARDEASSRLLPDTPISVPKLQMADVHLTYRGQRIEGNSMPLDNIEAALDIVNGQVNLHPLSFGVGSGRIKTNLELTPQGNSTHTKADVEFQRVDVSKLMASTHVFQGAGTISGTGSLDAVGASVAQLLQNGRGGMRVAMSGGDLSALLVNLSGLQFGQALLSALGLPTRTKVECFVGDTALQQGIFRIQTLVLDTGEGVITAQGGVNLRSEQLDLQLRTESKHFSIGSLPAPINIGGTLKHPSVMPGAELAVRGGVAAGLGVAFPPLALLPTIQFGTGDDHRCDRLLAMARQQPGGKRLPPAPNQQTGR